MWGFLFGLSAGYLLSEKPRESSARSAAEQAQTQVLIDIVKTCDAYEKTGPSPEELALMLVPIKKKFDAVDLSKFRSSEAQTVYWQMKCYFLEHMNVPAAEQSGSFELPPDAAAPADPLGGREPLSIGFDGRQVTENNYYRSIWSAMYLCRWHCGALHLFVPAETPAGFPGRRILEKIGGARKVTAHVSKKKKPQTYRMDLFFEGDPLTLPVIRLVDGEIEPAISEKDAEIPDPECQIHVSPDGRTAAVLPLQFRFVDDLPVLYDNADVLL